MSESDNHATVLRPNEIVEIWIDMLPVADAECDEPLFVHTNQQGTISDEADEALYESWSIDSLEEFETIMVPVAELKFERLSLRSE